MSSDSLTWDRNTVSIALFLLAMLEKNSLEYYFSVAVKNSIVIA